MKKLNFATIFFSIAILLFAFTIVTTDSTTMNNDLSSVDTEVNFKAEGPVAIDNVGTSMNSTAEAKMDMTQALIDYQSVFEICSDATDYDIGVAIRIARNVETTTSVDYQSVFNDEHLTVDNAYGLKTAQSCVAVKENANTNTSMHIYLAMVNANYDGLGMDIAQNSTLEVEYGADMWSNIMTNIGIKENSIVDQNIAKNGLVVNNSSLLRTGNATASISMNSFQNINFETRSFI